MPASERASERASGQGLAAKEPPPRRLPPSLPPSPPYCGHACCVPLGAAAFIARPARTALLPPALPPTVARSTTPSQYLGLRKKEEKEGLRRTDGRTDGRRTDADCQRGFKCSAFFRKAARSRRLRLGGRGRGRAGGIQLYRMADGRRADADGWEGALIFLAPSRDYRSLQSYLRLHEFGDTVQ